MDISIKRLLLCGLLILVSEKLVGSFPVKQMAGDGGKQMQSAFDEDEMKGEGNLPQNAGAKRGFYKVKVEDSDAVEAAFQVKEENGPSGEILDNRKRSQESASAPTSKEGEQQNEKKKAESENKTSNGEKKAPDEKGDDAKTDGTKTDVKSVSKDDEKKEEKHREGKTEANAAESEGKKTDERDESKANVQSWGQRSCGNREQGEV